MVRFGRFLLAAVVGVACTAAHARPAAPYVSIEILLDNSPSMEIGATPGDVAAMLYLTPCSVPGAVNGRRLGHSPASNQTYAAYRCAVQGNVYDGETAPFHEQACPLPAARGVADVAVMPMSGFIGPRCTSLLGAPPEPGPARIMTAGAPCAFACHWSHQPIGPTVDYYGIARSTIGQPPCYQRGAAPGACGITLRFDLVKNAVARLIDTMQERNAAGDGQFSVGVFTFDKDLHAVYPLPGACGAWGSPACQAGQDWPLALGSAGTAPGRANTQDAGIQPGIGANSGTTNLPGALMALARDGLTAAGSGQTPQSPRKALVLVTDGMADYFEGGTRRLKALDPSACEAYKAMGYRVFVLYTPYYPLTNPFYLWNVRQVAEGTGPGSLAYAMRRCASDPARDFIAASPADPASVSNALQLFLRRSVAGHA